MVSRKSLKSTKESFLNQVRLAGCHLASDSKLSGSVELCNRLAILFAVLLVPYIYFLIYDGFYSYIPLLCFSIVNCLLVPYLNFKGQFFKAKLYLLIVVNLSLFIFTCIFGREIRISIIFVNLLVTPIILFSYQNPETKLGKIIGLALPVTGLFITETFSFQKEFFRPKTLQWVQWMALFTTIVSGLMRQRQWDTIYSRHQEELEKYLSESEEAKLRLKEQSVALVQSSKMSALGQMSAGVAHEINNPLAIIKGKSYQIQTAIKKNAIEPEKILQQAFQIDQMVERITKIINGLRSFARDGQTDPFEMTSIHQIVEETLILCKSRFDNKDVLLTIKPIDPLIQVECRPVQVSQVIHNLLNNALDAVAALSEKWTVLEVSSDDQEVRISVTDSGNGILKELQDKILQPFFTTKEVGKGTGLGLSISNGIIKNHGGSLFIDPACTHTCFVITLPVRQKKV